MTVKDAITLTLNLLADCGVGDWNVEVIRDFGPEHPDRYGETCYRNKTIYLSARYLHDDGEMLKTARHEIGHVLCPPSSGGVDHNETWQRAMDLVPEKPIMHRTFRIEFSN